MYLALITMAVIHESPFLPYHSYYICVTRKVPWNSIKLSLDKHPLLLCVALARNGLGRVLGESDE